jgi:hypothetical protein
MTGSEGRTTSATIANPPAVGAIYFVISAEKTAHVLSGAVRGFKISAKDPAGLRSLIKDLLILVLGA